MKNIHATKVFNNESIKRFPNAMQAFESILQLAVENNSSDLHIDPVSSHTVIKLRIDGIINVFEKISSDIHEELIAHIKILAGCRTDLHIVPQDGRFNIKIGDLEYNIRASFMPTFYGENIVLRLLPMKSAESISFARLGFNIDHVKSIDNAMHFSHGIILVTGPTGSGKTTTLHACLNEKSKEKISVVTLEDPIEYEIKNVRQIRVEQNQGVTFSNVLRSVLRQDPDVIMVGEIRDNDTAELAMHTALTGHLVFSTIHTNGAFETITRLLDMGIDPYILSSTLRLIVSQRLVRNICTDCSRYGCDNCRMTGYTARTVIAEVLEIDDNMREYISSSASVSLMKEYIYELGWKSIEDDAREKVEWGVTSREEIVRVLGSFM